MQINLSKCNACGAVNTSNSKAWVNLNSARDGDSKPHNIRIDLCESCADKTSAKDLVRLSNEAIEAMVPKPIQRPQAAPAKPA